MNGSRSAASTGGITAFSTATTAATTNAPAPPMSTPGRIAAATPSDAAVSTQESSRRSGLNRGRSGCQATASP